MLEEKIAQTPQIPGGREKRAAQEVSKVPPDGIIFCVELRESFKKGYRQMD